MKRIVVKGETIREKKSDRNKIRTAAATRF
jgi:hypothetical protein